MIRFVTSLVSTALFVGPDMSRLLALALGLMLGLTAFAGWGETRPILAAPTGDLPLLSSPSSQTPSSVSSHRVEILRPGQESALFQWDTGRLESLTGPTFVTDESAASQIYLGEITHQRWMRFTRLPLAPFADSRSLPLLR